MKLQRKLCCSEPDWAPLNFPYLEDAQLGANSRIPSDVHLMLMHYGDNSVFQLPNSVSDIVFFTPEI